MREIKPLSENSSEVHQYLFKNFASHLFQAGAENALFQLFADQKWMKGRFQNGNFMYDGYLDDIEIAWLALGTLNPSYDQMLQGLRLSLISSSLNSVSSIYDPDLIKYAVSEGLWSVRRALSIISRMVEDNTQLDAYRNLLELKSLLTDEEYKTILDLAVKILVNEAYFGYSNKAELYNLFDDDHLEMVLDYEIDKVLSASDSRYFIKLPTTTFGLKTLIPFLKDNLINRVVNAVWKFSVEFQAGVIESLGPKINSFDMFNVYDQALSLPSHTNADKQPRLEALLGLYPYLEEEAQNYALGIMIEDFKNEWLGGLQNQAGYLSKLLKFASPDEKINLISYILNKNHEAFVRRNLLKTIISSIDEIPDLIFEETLKLKDDGFLVEILVEISNKLKETQLSKILDKAYEIEYSFDQIKVMVNLYNKTPFEQEKRKIRSHIYSLQDDLYRSYGIVKLYNQKNIKGLQQVLDSLESLSDESRRYARFDELLDKVHDIEELEMILESIANIKSAFYRTKLFLKIFPKLEDPGRSLLLENLLDSIRELQSPVDHQELIAELLDHLTGRQKLEILQWGLTLANNIEDEGYQVLACIGIIKDLPKKARPKVINWALAYLPKIQESSVFTHDPNQNKVIAGLIPYLSKRQLEKCLKFVDGYEELKNKIDAYKIYQMHNIDLDKDILLKLWKSVFRIEELKDRKFAIIPMLSLPQKYIPDDEIVSEIRKFDFEDRMDIYQEYLQYSPVSMLSSIIDDVLSIEDNQYKIKMLVKIIESSNFSIHEQIVKIALDFYDHVEIDYKSIAPLFQYMNCSQQEQALMYITDQIDRYIHTDNQNIIALRILEYNGHLLPTKKMDDYFAIVIKRLKDTWINQGELCLGLFDFFKRQIKIFSSKHLDLAIDHFPLIEGLYQLRFIELLSSYISPEQAERLFNLANEMPLRDSWGKNARAQALGILLPYLKNIDEQAQLFRRAVIDSFDYHRGSDRNVLLDMLANEHIVKHFQRPDFCEMYSNTIISICDNWKW